ALRSTITHQQPVSEFRHGDQITTHTGLLERFHGLSETPAFFKSPGSFETRAERCLVHREFLVGSTVTGSILQRLEPTRSGTWQDFTAICRMLCIDLHQTGVILAASANYCGFALLRS